MNKILGSGLSLTVIFFASILFSVQTAYAAGGVSPVFLTSQNSTKTSCAPSAPSPVTVNKSFSKVSGSSTITRTYSGFAIDQLKVLISEHSQSRFGVDASLRATSNIPRNEGGFDMVVSGTFFDRKTAQRNSRAPLGTIIRYGELDRIPNVNADPKDVKSDRRGGVAVLKDGTIVVARAHGRTLSDVNQRFGELPKNPVVDFMGGGALLVEDGRKVDFNSDLKSIQKFEGSLSSSDQFYRTQHIVIGIRGGQAFVFVVKNATGKEIRDDLHAMNFSSVVKFDGGSGCYVSQNPGGMDKVCYYDNPTGLGIIKKSPPKIITFDYAPDSFGAPCRAPVVAKKDVSKKGFMGCFAENRKDVDLVGLKGRVLDKSIIKDDPKMTIGKCINHCRGQKAAYAGLQYSKWCFCGDDPGKPIAGNKCNMKCSGDNTQVCGGAWANSVYDTNTTFFDDTEVGSNEIVKSDPDPTPAPSGERCVFKTGYMFNPEEETEFNILQARGLSRAESRYYYFTAAAKIPFNKSFPKDYDYDHFIKRARKDAEKIVAMGKDGRKYKFFKRGNLGALCSVMKSQCDIKKSFLFPRWGKACGWSAE